jgi:flavin-binding protein dodecin
MNSSEGSVRAFKGRSVATRKEPASLEKAISNAAEGASLTRKNGEWFEVARIQVQLLPHNQWVKAYSVTITPTG